MLNKFKNTRAYLDNYSKELVKLLKIEIGRTRNRTYPSKRNVNSPIDSSGELKDSIEYIAKKRKGSFSFNIMANSYGEKVDEGTKKGTSVPIQDLIKWIKKKPVRIRDSRKRFIKVNDLVIRGIATNIARKIDREGIRATNFISEAIEDSMGKLNLLGNSVGKDVSINLDDILLKAGYIKKGENYILQNKK